MSGSTVDREKADSKPEETRLPRRGFLKAAGVSAAGAILVGCDEDPDPYHLERPSVPGEQAWSTGEEKTFASACGQCAAGCGIRVRVVEGRAVKIEGNQECPLNEGSLGPKGQSGLQLLYHADRVKGPMRRNGPRGSGRWTEVGWDEAIAEVVRALRELRTQNEPQGLVVLDGEPRGLMPQLWERFLEAFGSPNHVDHRAMTDLGKVLAMTYMQGVPDLPAYDWDHTKYVLGFGSSLFESSCQTIHFVRSVAQMRYGTPGRRAKFVQVSPRCSVTTMKADEWVPIEPATYGALALGLAHVLVEKNAYDEAFVRDHTFGFAEWTDEEGKAHRGFRDLVLADYSPEKVSRITGIPAETIERLALEMADNRPAVAFADGGAAAATNGLGTAMAIHALNALLGNLQRRGGLLVQRTVPFAPWPALEPDAVARAGRAAPRADGVGTAACPLGRSFPQGLPDAILAGRPYPIKALFLYKSNPVYSKPDGRRWIEALERVPLVVSFSPLEDESALWADLVLPDHTYLERWEVVEPVPATGCPTLTFRQPVVTPLHDTMATGDVLIRLAKEIGAPVRDAFPWRSYRQATTARLRGVAEAGSGSEAEDGTNALLRKLREDGFWSSPGYPYEEWEGAFRTPSGKFEFYSRQIAAKLGSAFPDASGLESRLAAVGVATRGDDLHLPHFEPPVLAGDPEQFPFVLVAYRGMEYAEGGARHLSELRELPLAGRGAWKERVEINPVDARRLGLHENDTVSVESTAGRRRLVVRFEGGTRPGTVGIRLGHGPWPPDPGTKEQVGGYALLASAADPLAGIFALQGTRVRVRKVGA